MLWEDAKLSYAGTNPIRFKGIISANYGTPSLCCKDM